MTAEELREIIEKAIRREKEEEERRTVEIKWDSSSPEWYGKCEIATKIATILNRWWHRLILHWTENGFEERISFLERYFNIKIKTIVL